MNSIVRDIETPDSEGLHLFEVITTEDPGLPAEQPLRDESDSRNHPVQGYWTISQDDSSGRANTPFSASLRTSRPFFLKGSNIAHESEIHVKLGQQQTLSLGLGQEENFTGRIRLYMKRTVFATDPFTGEGGIDCPEEIAVGDFSRRDWPFRAHGCDKKAVNYIQVGSNACIDVNLMNEDKLFLKFVKLSTHLSADEKKRGMNMQAKKMSLILESLQDPEDRVEIPIQVVCEPRPEPVRKRKFQNNTRQTTIKTEPMAAIEEMEPVVKLPNVEVIPNMVGLTKEEKIQMIADHLHAAPSQLTDAIFFILRQAPVVSFEGNFQSN